MGGLFGLVNELVLVMFAAGLAAMVVTGHVMWWRTRPTRVVRQPQRSPLMLLRKTPIVPLLLIVSLTCLTLLLGFCLPMMGISLLIFLLCDLIRYQLTKREKTHREIK